MGDESNGLGGVPLGVADPGESVPGFLDEDLADPLDERDFVGGADQGLIAVHQGAQLSVRPTQRLFGSLTLGPRSQGHDAVAQVA